MVLSCGLHTHYREAGKSSLTAEPWLSAACVDRPPRNVTV